ncbi:hypothetical protein, partial [Xanthomonas citri]
MSRRKEGMQRRCVSAALGSVFSHAISGQHSSEASSQHPMSQVGHQRLNPQPSTALSNATQQRGQVIR